MKYSEYRFMRETSIASVDNTNPTNFDETKLFILGSGSKTRKDILKAAGYNFEVWKVDIDEKSIGDRESDPVNLVRLLAAKKADAVMKTLPEHLKGNILLTGDQVVVHKNRILEKPSDLSEARRFIESYSNDRTSTVGSIALTDTRTGRRVIGVDTATIHFRPFPSDVIDRLIAEGEVLFCAGGLMVEHPLIQPFIERIEGTQESLMGLSVNLLESLLLKYHEGRNDEI